MNTKPYRATSLRSAEREVRALRRRVRIDSEAIDGLIAQRYLLAKLAAKSPQFDSPLDAWKAEAVRDEVLQAPIIFPKYMKSWGGGK